MLHTVISLSLFFSFFLFWRCVVVKTQETPPPSPPCISLCYSPSQKKCHLLTKQRLSCPASLTGDFLLVRFVHTDRNISKITSGLSTFKLLSFPIASNQICFIKQKAQDAKVLFYQQSKCCRQKYKTTCKVAVGPTKCGNNTKEKQNANEPNICTLTGDRHCFDV